MGEAADLILEGVVCEQCGEYIGNPTGFPRKCTDCKNEKEEE